MTKITKEAATEILGSQLNVDIPEAPLKLDVQGAVDVDSELVGVNTEVNEKSLQKAYAKIGEDMKNAPGSKGADAGTKSESKGRTYSTDAFASKTSSASKMKVTHNTGFNGPQVQATEKPTQMVSQKEKARRAKIKKQIELAQLKKNRVKTLNAEMLSTSDKKRLVEDYERRGAVNSPLGAVKDVNASAATLKKTGVPADGLREAYKKWGPACFPGSVPEDMPTFKPKS